MPKSDVSQERGRDRSIVLTFLIGYVGFIAGTVLIPISPTVGGIVFWAGVFGIFWAGWSSSKK